MKYAYITSGTEHYLRQILSDNPTRDITLLQNFGDSILLEETAEPTVFKEGTAYRINKALATLEATAPSHSNTYIYVLKKFLFSRNYTNPSR
ncbi:hypothetical protein [Listeria cornellensis]|uniref:Uncharacterized protein n=1 Tax=Listeria cornellensis FSL F6-0969 TaxID=1265820 RepID=W7BQR1_9LIST|nr:hypothetical protein [Listeria cornellensis]EUJ29109.1 hypothetical protein PCORN_11582 [Listeria cornellensis FSL F6-0969]